MAAVRSSRHGRAIAAEIEGVQAEIRGWQASVEKSIEGRDEAQRVLDRLERINAAAEAEGDTDGDNGGEA